jgi:hypothetical protein
MYYMDIPDDSHMMTKSFCQRCANVFVGMIK